MLEAVTSLSDEERCNDRPPPKAVLGDVRRKRPPRYKKKGPKAPSEKYKKVYDFLMEQWTNDPSHRPYEKIRETIRMDRYRD
ncbi:unnamed protein product, partial [Durusdinium trenchii]